MLSNDLKGPESHNVYKGLEIALLMISYHLISVDPGKLLNPGYNPHAGPTLVKSNIKS